MLNRIDAHILKGLTDNKPWFEECLNSLKDEPVNIHTLPGIAGNLLQARINGYSLGDAEFVSFVDPDDYVMPGAFKKCIDSLDSKPDLGGVWTNSNTIDFARKKTILFYPENTIWNKEYHIRSRCPIHQVCVVRRKIIEQAIGNINLLDESVKNLRDSFSDQIIFANVARLAPWYFIPFIGYVWRKHPQGGHLNKLRVDRNIKREYMQKLLGEQ